MLPKYFFAWFPMVIIAILNGSLRQFVIMNYVDELTAHQISCFTGILFFAVYIYFITRRWKIESCRQSWIIGVMWIAMTIIFEFGFGHYVMGHPWEKLFHDYNIFAGRLWIVVLIWTLIAPNLFYKLQKRK
jgi:hypothetical protein